MVAMKSFCKNMSMVNPDCDRPSRMSQTLASLPPSLRIKLPKEFLESHGIMVVNLREKHVTHQSIETSSYQPKISSGSPRSSRPHFGGIRVGGPEGTLHAESVTARPAGAAPSSQSSISISENGALDNKPAEFIVSWDIETLTRRNLSRSNAISLCSTTLKGDISHCISSIPAVGLKSHLGDRAASISIIPALANAAVEQEPKRATDRKLKPLAPALILEKDIRALAECNCVRHDQLLTVDVSPDTDCFSSPTPTLTPSSSPKIASTEKSKCSVRHSHSQHADLREMAPLVHQGGNTAEVKAERQGQNSSSAELAESAHPREVPLVTEDLPFSILSTTSSSTCAERREDDFGSVQAHANPVVNPSMVEPGALHEGLCGKAGLLTSTKDTPLTASRSSRKYEAPCVLETVSRAHDSQVMEPVVQGPGICPSARLRDHALGVVYNTPPPKSATPAFAIANTVELGGLHCGQIVESYAKANNDNVLYNELGGLEEMQRHSQEVETLSKEVRTSQSSVRVNDVPPSYMLTLSVCVARESSASSTPDQPISSTLKEKGITGIGISLHGYRMPTLSTLDLDVASATVEPIKTTMSDSGMENVPRKSTAVDVGQLVVDKRSRYVFVPERQSGVEAVECGGLGTNATRMGQRVSDIDAKILRTRKGIHPPQDDSQPAHQFASAAAVDAPASESPIPDLAADEFTGERGRRVGDAQASASACNVAGVPGPGASIQDSKLSALLDAHTSSHLEHASPEPRSLPARTSLFNASNPSSPPAVFLAQITSEMVALVRAVIRMSLTAHLGNSPAGGYIAPYLGWKREGIGTPRSHQLAGAGVR
ncbi:hypothetical protein B0H13DRAFT_1905099 [Mycena leptocephala]|nr:hypothetical protein B0H13DRAFT_1905099 [Mycena leptocephala]